MFPIHQEKAVRLGRRVLGAEARTILQALTVEEAEAARRVLGNIRPTAVQEVQAHVAVEIMDMPVLLLLTRIPLLAAQAGAEAVQAALCMEKTGEAALAVQVSLAEL